MSQTYWFLITINSCLELRDWLVIVFDIFLIIYRITRRVESLSTRFSDHFMFSRPWCRRRWRWTGLKLTGLIWRRVNYIPQAGFDVTRCNLNYQLSNSSMMIRFGESTSFDEITRTSYSDRCGIFSVPLSQRAAWSCQHKHSASRYCSSYL